MKKIYILFLSFFVIMGSISAQEVTEDIGIKEHLDEYIPDGIYLIDQDSNRVELKSLITKPTIFSFVYYNCPGLCSPLLGGLADVIERGDLTLGKEYQAITISFNPEDGPTLGKAKKENFLNLIDRTDVDKDKWMWFTADSTTIQQITTVLGFRYKKEGKDYAHAASIMMVSPEAKITRYLYGTEFLPFDVKMAVYEAEKGISSPTINKVLNFCFSYDPQGKKYVMNITKISGTFMILFAAAYFFFLIFRKKPSITEPKSE